MFETATALNKKVFVCRGTSCESGKSEKIYNALKSGVMEAGQSGIDIDFSGCHGFCQQGPIVEVLPDGYFYAQVSPEDVPDILMSLKPGAQPVARLFYKNPVTGEPIPKSADIPFYARQHRILLRHCGSINPEKIEDYIAVGGYDALKKVVAAMTPEQVIREIKKSGQRGRGGAGFLTGQKWDFLHHAKGRPKYLICNADEGDPGAFMDRSILEADPHSVLEGMVIAAYATGATEGYIYCRVEYPMAIARLKLALQQMEQHQLIGKNILGSNLDFHIHIKEGAGAFVCGEETALMQSIEGKRGMPRPRPPFPADSGLWGKPTNINNVKSYAF
ncbi:MAG TPA: NAD(P)H-dependent oxidoreductase subunit E, partial [Dehalococcoidales bacterium]|nr:NAD(P)H-dependent oxidoreductase subunit E [Dehalococcoidales bacterium]